MPKKSDGGLTHTQLNTYFKTLGKQMSKKVASKNQNLQLKYKVTVTEYTLLEAQSKLEKNWGAFYRTRSVAMDELMSTATIRDVIKGLTKGDKLSPAGIKLLTERLNDISRVRLPTRYVGYAFKTPPATEPEVQHPTAEGTGFWLGGKKQGAHYSLDLKRRRAVYAAMQDEVTNGKTAQAVLRTGLLRSMTFTLNEFMAPATASNVKTTVTDSAEKLKQVTLREKLKNDAVGLGAPRSAGTDTSRSRPWERRIGSREISPERTT